MSKAKFIKEITVIDPDTKSEVNLSIYKHEGGGIFGVDSSFINQFFDDNDDAKIPDPFALSGSSVVYVTLED